jgi:hypothetical protein
VIDYRDEEFQSPIAQSTYNDKVLRLCMLLLLLFFPMAAELPLVEVPQRCHIYCGTNQSFDPEVH